jgi:hypothetical protein
MICIINACVEVLTNGMELTHHLFDPTHFTCDACNVCLAKIVPLLDNLELIDRAVGDPVKIKTKQHKLGL